MFVLLLGDYVSIGVYSFKEVSLSCKLKSNSQHWLNQSLQDVTGFFFESLAA